MKAKAVRADSTTCRKAGNAQTKFLDFMNVHARIYFSQNIKVKK